MSIATLIELILLVLLVIWAPWFYVTSIRPHPTFEREKVGAILILLGVCTWVVYLTLKVFDAYSGSVMPFLIVHLSGVIPGAFLKGRGWARRIGELLGRNESHA